MENIGTLGRVGHELSNNAKNTAAIVQSWTSGVRPDVRSISEKYLSRNKKENIRTLTQVGHKVSDNTKHCIHCTELDIQSLTGHPWYVGEIF